MTCLYFDCFSGISGDMILGSLLDLGLSLDALSDELSKLNIQSFKLSARKVHKLNIAATKFEVETKHEPAHRGYPVIEKIINESRISSNVVERATRIFYRLAEAEAKVHGTTLDRVHFHEVGAVDAIVDIVGACVGLEQLGVQEVYASALNVGRGSVESAHGVLPVPAPATTELLKGIPIYSNQVGGELVTPTGAAILSTLCQGFGELPPFKIEKVGYGAGTRDNAEAPNVLRVFQGEMLGKLQRGAGVEAESTVLVVEANIDDMNPQIYGHLQERLFALGVLDIFACPVQMKKNRPGILVTVVTPEALLEEVSDVFFRETTTIGIRFHEAQRKTLERQVEVIESEFGKVNVKVSTLNGKIVNFSPEYEDCRRIATQQSVPYKWVHSRIIQEFMNRHARDL
jgi:pyridinium-3,5-bisthiocarboxylic acid mononucleotide nickel chelatase